MARIKQVIAAYRQAWRIVPAYPGAQILLSVYMFLELPTAILLPMLSKYTMDGAILGRNLSLFLTLTVITVACGALNLAAGLAYAAVMNNYRMRCSRRTTLFLLRKALQRPCAPGRIMSFEELFTKLMEDASSVVQAVALMIPNIAFHALRGAMLLVVCLYLEPAATGIALVLLPLNYAIGHRAGAWGAWAFDRTRQAAQNLYGILLEVARHFVGMKANRLEGAGLSRFHSGYNRLIRTRLEAGAIGQVGTTGQKVLMGTYIFLITFYFTVLVIREEITLGFFLAYSMYLKMLIGNLAAYGQQWQKVLSTLPAFERVFSLLEQTPAVPTGYADLKAPPEVKAENVCLAVGGRRVFEAMNFHVSPGHLAVVHGKNGAGKTMLLHLLAGVIRPDTGIVRVDGHDLADFRSRNLRERLAVILCGEPLDEVFFPKKPAALSGAGHSTGQAYMRQFEFFLSRPVNFILLDEPFANLDAVHHEMVKKRLLHRRGAATMVVTCHESAALGLAADSVWEIQNGRMRRRA